MRKFYFTHRPPVAGVHLLNDPMPPFGDGATVSRLAREHLEALKRQVATVKSKKSRPQA